MVGKAFSRSRASAAAQRRLGSSRSRVSENRADDASMTLVQKLASRAEADDEDVRAAAVEALA